MPVDTDDGRLRLRDGFAVERDDTTWFANRVHLVPSAADWLVVRAPGTVRVYPR